eukprot:6039288-Pyramimonas_sp.AAC.1
MPSLDVRGWWPAVRQVDERFAHQLTEAEAAPEALSQSAIARLKGRIASMLTGEETVLKALKRLGTKEALSQPEGKKAFEELTEMASTLMTNGEYEVCRAPALAPLDGPSTTGWMD